MSHLLRNFFTLEKAAAWLCWVSVSLSSLYFLHQSENHSVTAMVQAAVLFSVFIISFMIGIREDDFAHDTAIRLSMLVLSFLTCVAIYFSVPYLFTAIFMVMWTGQLPYYMSMRTAVLISPLFALPMYLVYTYYWGYDNIAVTALLFWTFNLFSLAMIGVTRKAELAREQADALNRELMATQSLLSEATKQAERVRIARNIHDLLGHHLTALTINLQVASRLSEGQAKEKVEECHALSKLLLSDVREAVSEIREKSSLHLKSALQSLIANVPNISITMEYDDDVKVDDVHQAEVLLRCVQESITNSLKHSKADAFTITLRQDRSGLHLDMQDNGKKQGAFVKGNGLTGMIERVKAIGGKIEFEQSGHGFATHVLIPEEA